LQKYRKLRWFSHGWSVAFGKLGKFTGMNVSQILAEVKQAVLKMEPTADIILFGSQVKNKAGKYSDIDLLILLDGARTYNDKLKISRAIYDIELKYEKVIESFILSNDEWRLQRQKFPFYHEIQAEGVPL